MTKRTFKFSDSILKGGFIMGGSLMMLVVFGVLYFLGSEAKPIQDRAYGFGYRFAIQSADYPIEPSLLVDPNASRIGATADTSDDVDDQEDGILMPTLEELSGVVAGGIGSPIGEASPETTYRENIQQSKPSTVGRIIDIYAFATPEIKGKTFDLAWEADNGFDPKASPFGVKLTLVSGPKDAPIGKSWDLRAMSKGKITLPTAIAATNDDRWSQYKFKLEVLPGSNNWVAGITDFMSNRWSPKDQYPRFGMWPLVLSTLIMTFGAVLLATIPSFACAIYLREMASARVRGWLKPTIELLASVPTVVLAYFGLMLLAPRLQAALGSAGMESGRAMLTVIIVMAVLLIPTITTLAEDALSRVPNTLRDGAEGVGLTHSEGIFKVILPAARGGLIAATMFGFARAFGETMIVWILSGGTANMPALNLQSLVGPTRGVSDTVGIEMGDVAYGSAHYGYLFLLGLVLFGVVWIVNVFGFKLARKAEWQQ
jgi:phosphate ABC transporter permease protein PstC